MRDICIDLTIIENTKKRNSIVVILLILQVLFFVCSIMRNQLLRHIIQLIGNAVLIFSSGKSLFSQKFSLLFILLILYSIVDILLTVLVSPLSTFVNQIVAGVCFLALVIMLGANGAGYLTKKYDKIIILTIMVISLLCLVETGHPNAYIFEDGSTNGSLVLGTTNSAYLGMLLSGVINILLIYFTENKKRRWYLLLISFVVLYLLWLTHSRGALLSTIVVMAYSLLGIKTRVKEWFVRICLFFPILTSFIFLYLESLSSQNLLFLGKPLSSGRGIVYQEEIELLKTPIDVIFGNHSGFMFENAHNGYLMVLVSIGVLGLVLLYVFFNKTLKKVSKNLISNKGKTALVALLSVFIMSGIEALPLMGRFPYSMYIYVYILIIFSEVNKKSSYIIDKYVE